MQKVLVVAVHPDDETLGCGGTLLQHKAQGDEIHWMIVTAMSKECGFASETMARRDREIESVAQMYGFDSVHSLGFPATRMDEVPIFKLVEAISGVFMEIQPNYVYLPFQNDVHTDHNIAFTAAYSCTKNFRYPFLKKVMMMETLSETDFANVAAGSFSPNMFVDVSEHFEKKLDILKVFRSEIGAHPFPRSIDGVTALAMVRGAVADCRYAESFMILKEVVGCRA
jgi:LmbE family N-acetylglucosaminyl deacetylase